MANHKDALKRMRQNERQRIRNKHFKTQMRHHIRDLLTVIESGDKEAASAKLRETVSMIQRVSQKGIIHSRQAARRVSRLQVRVNGMG